MDLHYSQTDENIVNSLLCFTTLWIYTTLKRFFICEFETVGFTTLWIYTTLKLQLWPKIKLPRFTTLWIYTTLKRTCSSSSFIRVLLPYGFTLLSNLKFQSTFFAFRQQISGIQESKRRHYIASGNHKAALLYHYFFVSATISHKSLSITETFSSGSLWKENIFSRKIR